MKKISLINVNGVCDSARRPQSAFIRDLKNGAPDVACMKRNYGVFDKALPSKKGLPPVILSQDQDYFQSRKIIKNELKPSSVKSTKSFLGKMFGRLAKVIRFIR